MASTFTWLDHSDKERRRVLDAIDRFKESSTRDELGLAPIRDGFSDLFFPGTGVLMTRARYFLFVPWIYQSIERRRGSRNDVAGLVRRAEVQLIETLGDELGAIGRLAKGTLKRMPSSIYWLGLERWGIRTFRGTQPEYHRLLELGGAADDDVARDDDGEPIDGSVRRNWHAGLPPAPEGFPKQVTLGLTAEEGTYLRERIRLSAPRSMLALLLRPGWLPDVEYPWMHPRLGELPGEVRHALHHARCFAETMHGAALVYNLMLAELGKRDTVDDFRARIAEWSAELAERASELATWNVADFWRLATTFVNVHPVTRAFVNQWIELRPWESAARACDDATVRRLIDTRERQLKGPRARLTHPRALELWGGESGTRRLVYRWPTAHRLVTDIVEAGDA